MGYLCGCQLPKNPEEYCWAICTNDDSIADTNIDLNCDVNLDPNDYYVYIAPQNDFHWDGGLAHIICDLLPEGLHEICESMFDFSGCNENIIKLMKESKIIYSENLRDVIEFGKRCECNNCTNPNLIATIEFVNIGQEKCSHGYHHIIKN